MRVLRLLYLFIIIMAASNVVAQQSSSWSSFYENGFIWNPALTARWNTMETSVTTRQEWIGFEGAPQQATVGYQYPFVPSSYTSNKNYNSVSAGGYLEYDAVGPFSKYGLTGTYAYRIRPKLFGNGKDVLTFGAKLSFNQYRFTNKDVVTFSGELNPDLIPDQTGFIPDVGAGIYYVTESDLKINNSHYYIGLALNNLLPLQVNTGPLGSYTQVPQASMHGGYRYYPHRKTYFYEPSIFVNYAFTRAVNVMGTMRFEMVDRFWVSMGLVSNQEVFGQIGFIFNNASLLGPIIKDGILRIGVKSDYNFGPFRNFSGIGAEAYIAYLINYRY